ncbi:hypothetical protein [Reinekea marinisedimentorum]|uniref:Outer membrane beta-barrel porin/alpha-amylase n=1 Tax=Reinekea marinisedimentorum TaxID=230495 RepID=A0A4R3I707_9GAMM|nr:hypothetical protein [Reinekea marinisedimentorum]TCS41916.1 hypothetical protein BCF53_10420 [Reinekea marinisedimentorum]
MRSANTIKLLTLMFCLTTNVFADNLLTDTFLQPSQVKTEKTGVKVIFKLGINEGSGEISNEDGYRVDLPRITLQKNVADEILFRASVPWVYLNSDNDEDDRYTLGDPSFLTTVQIKEHNTFTVGVTEPAANRPLEPDVVRFYAFYTHGIPTRLGYITGQFGPEIPDVYGGEGQNDLLSAGLSLRLNNQPIDFTLIRKFEVTSKWWNFTKTTESELNRTNFTMGVTQDIQTKWFNQLKWFAGVQENDGMQYIFGLQLD